MTLMLPAGAAWASARTVDDYVIAEHQGQAVPTCLMDEVHVKRGTGLSCPHAQPVQRGHLHAQV